MYVYPYVCACVSGYTCVCPCVYSFPAPFDPTGGVGPEDHRDSQNLLLKVKKFRTTSTLTALQSTLDVLGHRSPKKGKLTLLYFRQLRPSKHNRRDYPPK